MTATNVINSLKSLSKSADDKLLQFSNHEVKLKEWLQLIKDTAYKIVEDDDSEEYTKNWIDLPSCRDFVFGESVSSNRNSKAFEKRAHVHNKRRTNGRISTRLSSKKKFSIEAQSRKSVKRTEAFMVNGNSSSAQKTFDMTPQPMTPVQASSSVLKSTHNMKSSASNKKIKLDESVQRKSIKVLRKSCKIAVTPTGSIAGKTLDRLALQKENKPLLSKKLTTSSVSKTASQKQKLESKLKQINRITADKMSIGVKKSDFGAQKLALSNNKKPIKVSKVSTKVDLTCASDKKKNLVSQPRSSPRLQGKHVSEQNAVKAATKSKAANKKVVNVKTSVHKMNEKTSISCKPNQLVQKKTDKTVEKDAQNTKSNPPVLIKVEKVVKPSKTANSALKKEEPTNMNRTFTSENSPADQVKKQLQENAKKQLQENSKKENKTPDSIAKEKASGSASNSKKPQSSTPAAPTATSYEISDIGSDSDDETESDSSKFIPPWAIGYLFKNALISAAHNPTNPQLVFGRCNKKPDLEEIFNVKNQKYKVRSSSAIWNSPGSFLAS